MTALNFLTQYEAAAETKTLKKYWIRPIDQQLATIATGRIAMQNSEEWVVCNEFSQSNYCDARLCREKHKHCMDIKSFSNSSTIVGDWMFCTNYWDPLAALNKTQMLQGESDRISRRTWIVAKTTKKSSGIQSFLMNLETRFSRELARKWFPWIISHVFSSHHHHHHHLRHNTWSANLSTCHTSSSMQQRAINILKKATTNLPNLTHMSRLQSCCWIWKIRLLFSNYLIFEAL